MAQKNKVTVYIAGNEYVIAGHETEEYIQKVALFVDQKLRDIAQKNHFLSTSMASVLASVNMADEVFRTREKLQETERELTELKKRYQQQYDELQHLRKENDRLKQRETQLQIELTKRETEIKEIRNTLNTFNTMSKKSKE
ncbi:MAG: cell division protein ZapA [Clostridiaceae bacterium]|nr:cell division protein ZapA [Clostridiaceae bacterium]